MMWWIIGGIAVVVVGLVVLERKWLRYHFVKVSGGLDMSLRDVQVAQVKKIIKVHNIKKRELYG